MKKTDKQTELAYCFASGRSITLESTGRGGGEGKIYRVLEEPALVAKVYHAPKRSPDRGAKLAAMLAEPPLDPALLGTLGDGAAHQPAIAWPIELIALHSAPNTIAGFLMPWAEQMRPLHDFYTPKTRRQEIFGLTYRYLVRLGRNLSAAVAALHDRGYVIGDVNESNVLAAKTALITLVDTDSFQVRDRRTGRIYRCPVGKGDYTAPELQGANFQQVDRTLASDQFGLAVLLFQLLMEGTHPFDGAYAGGGDPPSKEMRIARGWFPYGLGDRGGFRPKPIAPSFDSLTPDLQALFRLAFEGGPQTAAARPTAQTWVTALEAAEAELVICDRNDRHVHWPHRSPCPWCERTARFKGRDPFPSREALLHGDHLKPVKPSRQAPRLVVPAARPRFFGGGRSAQTLPIPPLTPPGLSARLYWLSPGYSAAANWVSIAGLTACFLVIVAIILGRDWLDFSTPGVPSLIPRYVAATPSEPERATARGQFNQTRSQLQAIVNQLDQDLAARFPSLPANQRRSRLIRELALVLGDGNLVYDGGPVTGSNAGVNPDLNDSTQALLRDRWIDAIYSFQARQGNKLKPLGYFDPANQTAQALADQIRDRLESDLATLVPPIEAPTPAPGLIFPDR